MTVKALDQMIKGLYAESDCDSSDQGEPYVAAETGQDMVKASKAAEKLGVHPRTIKRAIASGQIPGTRVGTLYLVNGAWLADVTSWAPPQEAVA